MEELGKTKEPEKTKELEKTNKLTLLNLAEEYVNTLNKLYLTDGELTPEIEQALDSLMKQIEHKQDGYIVVMDSFDKKIEQAEEYIRGLQAYMRKIKTDQDKLKDRIRLFMEETGINKIQGELGSISLINYPLLPDDLREEELPDEYKETVTTIKIDKNKLKKDIKEGRFTDIQLVDNYQPKIYRRGK